jgi:sugar lactone lactonase YvrE
VKSLEVGAGNRHAVVRSCGMRNGGAVGLIAGLICLLILALTASTVQAEIAYVPYGESGSGVLGDVPGDVAVEDATGRVFVTDSENDRIVIFESGEPGAGVLTTFGEGELSDPYGIAIDQSSGAVYVSDAGNNRIVRYSSDDGDPPTYTLDIGFPSPAKGSGVGEVGDFASPLAIDSTSADLVVADTGNLRVERFGEDGGFLDSFDGADSDAGAFTSLFDIATAPDGTIYVIANGVSGEFNSIANSLVETFSSAGTFEETVAPGQFSSARAVAFDPRSDDLLVINGGSFLEGRNLRLWAVHIGPDGQEGSEVRSTEIPTPEECTLAAGIAAPGPSGLPLSIVTARDVELGCGVASVQSLSTLSAKVSPPSAVTSSSAHLSGTVDAGGEEAIAHFEYRQVGSPTWTSTPDQAVSGDGAQPVEDDISGLLANREYEVKLTASRLGISSSDTTALTTGLLAPTAISEPATEAVGSSATLNGSVDPNGAATTFFFEYGPTEAYGVRIPAAPTFVGDGFVKKRLSRSIGGLVPGAIYHFRIVAENGAGTVEGDDLTFVAGGGLIENRVFEQVTPVDKEGSIVDPRFSVLPLSDGSGVAYTLRGASKEAEGTPVATRYLSLRGSTDWDKWLAADPPMTVNGNGPTFYSAVATSDDGRFALVASNKVLTPDAEGEHTVGHLYRKNLATRHYELVGTGPSFNEWATLGRSGAFLGGNRDLSNFYFSSISPLLEEAEGKGRQVYHWSEGGGLELASLLPDDSVPAEAEILGGAISFSYARYSSPDLGRLYFTVPGTGVFMREDGVTAPISISEIDGAVKPASFSGTDASGRYAFFVSEAEMIEGEPPCSRCLYRADTLSGDLELISQVNSAVGRPGEVVAGIAPDGDTVYFSGPSNDDFSVWHAGSLKIINTNPNTTRPVVVSMSANGRFAAYSPNGSEPEPIGDVYLYDTETEEQSCVSCSAAEPTGAAQLSWTLNEFNNAHGEAVTDRGEVYFATSAPLLPNDTNGTFDVYGYRGGELGLVSPGNSPVPAYLGGIAADGRDVFIGTAQGLVPQDIDGQIDIYDARVGGGFGSQQVVPPQGCSGEACQPPASSGPAAPSFGSEQPANASRTQHKHAKKRKKCIRVKKRAKCVQKKHPKAKNSSGRVR